MSFFFPATAKHKYTLIALLLALFLLISLALSSVQPPAPALTPQTPAAGQFSLIAAQTQLREITRERHPVGSLAHDAVRDYLVAEIKAMGLEPQIHNSFASFEKGTASGQVQNIVVRLSGRNAALDQNKKALLLVAHYDAVPNSFGAGDDGVSVISILQTLRVLKSQAPLANDVICLLSDAEEVGLLGAAGFAKDHTWMKDVGMLLNFDNRGNAGPVLMFEPTAGNGQLITGLAQAVPGVISNSMMYEVYKALPNDTDFTVFRKQGIPGLNFAMIQNISSYHTRYDRSELISPASQQQQGAMMLALVRHFGNQDLTQLTADDHVYFSFPLLGLVHYPVGYALPIALLISALGIACFWLARKHGQVRALATLGASFALLLGLIAIGYLVQQAWNLVFKFYPAYLEMHDQDTGHFYLLGVLLLSALGFGFLQKVLNRWIRVQEWAHGAALIWIVLLLMTSARFPGASFLFAWPLCAVLLSWLLIRLRKIGEDSATYIWLIGAGSVVGIVLFSPLVLLFNIALGFHSLGVPVILFLILLSLLTPLWLWILQECRARYFLLISVVAVVVGAFATAAFHRDFPIPPQLVYVAMPQSQLSYWLTPQQAVNAQLLPMLADNPEHRTVPELFGKNMPRGEWVYWLKPAPDAGIAAPVLQLVSDQVVGDSREITLHISSPDRANHARIQVEGGSVLSARLQGLVLTKEAKEKWTTSVHAMPTEGVNLYLQIAKDQAPASMTVRVTDSFYVLPTTAKNIVAPPATSVDFVAQTISSLQIP
ncbi:M28 family peptidase [Undibacterium flavidum]|uniref:Vacuolar membrane protease n=1 Tax=Undibacterium flavidum TaxID=2762297 RepID=A0ABR6Y970_9BURK|nr:M28 family peptidase [Undibacterium flavidum]MBC3873160.1 M28 family peptidase [Undibacterium flavidum]